MEADFKRLGHIWEDIFQHFMNEIVHAIDSEVDFALNRFRHELSTQMAPFTPLPPSPSPTTRRSINEDDLMMRKRKMDDVNVNRDGDMINRSISGSGFMHASSREEQMSKRRRLAGDHPMDPSIDTNNSDVFAMVKEMTAKLRSQETALAKLREENDRVDSIWFCSERQLSDLYHVFLAQGTFQLSWRCAPRYASTIVSTSHCHRSVDLNARECYLSRVLSNLMFCYWRAIYNVVTQAMLYALLWILTCKIHVLGKHV